MNEASSVHFQAPPAGLYYFGHQNNFKYKVVNYKVT